MLFQFQVQTSQNNLQYSVNCLILNQNHASDIQDYDIQEIQVQKSYSIFQITEKKKKEESKIRSWLENIENQIKGVGQKSYIETTRDWPRLEKMRGRIMTMANSGGGFFHLSSMEKME